MLQQFNDITKTTSEIKFKPQIGAVDIINQIKNKKYATISQKQIFEIKENINNNFVDDKVITIPTFIYRDERVNIETVPFYFLTANIIIKKVKNYTFNKFNQSDGSIKKYINSDDYELQFDTAILSHNFTDKPADELERIITILNLNQAIPIYNDFLNSFNISNIIITSYEFLSTYNMKNMYNCRINAVSEMQNNIIKL